jgi:hypothetical protein
MGTITGTKNKERSAMIMYAVHNTTGAIYHLENKKLVNLLSKESMTFDLEEAKRVAKEVNGRVLKYNVMFNLIGAVV